MRVNGVTSMITKTMKIADILKKKPEATEIMFKHGLNCVGCKIGLYESLEDGAKSHGMDNKEISVAIVGRDGKRQPSEGVENHRL